MEEHDEGMVYELDGRVVYRASTFGSCEKALVAARLGYTPSGVPKSLQAVFEAGKAAEAWYVDNHPVAATQDTVRLDVPGTNVSIRGHIDGMKKTGVSVVVEIKSQSPDMYDRWTPQLWYSDPLWMKYAWQCSIYQHAVGGAELELVRIRRPRDNDDYQFDTQNYRHPFHTLQEIYNRANKLEMLAERTNLGDIDCPESFGCPYWQLHPVNTEEVVVDGELDNAITMFENWRKARIFASEEEKAAKEALVKVLGDRKSVKTSNGWQVKHTTFEKKGYEVKARTETRLTVTRSEDAG